MAQLAFPSLQVVCDRLNQSSVDYHFLVWATSAPYVRGYGNEDILWEPSLSQIWLAWQDIFAPNQVPHHPVSDELIDPLTLTPDPHIPLSGRLMQELGVRLWKWLFQGAIAESFARTEGMAIGQNQALRLRLDLRDPNLIPLPWEIMQPDMGKQAISLNPQVFFSRTIGDVSPLQLRPTGHDLNILLVLGQPELNSGQSIDLTKEAEKLQSIWQEETAGKVHGEVLVQPTPDELSSKLAQSSYQLFFYSGHGEPAPDGGNFFLNEHNQMNGKELAQILVRHGIRAAIFNACWGATPKQYNHQAIATSSLAEVLIHHGVPAVLAMRDSISDEEAFTLATTLSQSLCQYHSLDHAVAIARQALLTQFKFNSPAWTLPILYMHPEFDGQILSHTTIPSTGLPTLLPQSVAKQMMRLESLLYPEKTWSFYGKLIRIGRRSDNDVVLDEQWVSKYHAEIILREDDYILRDRSRFGTLIALPNGAWQTLHQGEMLLQTGSQIRFGSEQGEPFRFFREITGKATTH